jgi:hypothetical protein
MEEWHDLFVASAGAAAVLMGLLFVGLSINLSKILAFPVLANRALIASMLLLSILIPEGFARRVGIGGGN